MALRVRDIVTKNLLNGIKLVAGYPGADKPVTWVTVMEILDTPESLQKGELLVTTGYRLSDEERHKGLMYALHQRDICGIAIQTGYYINEIPSYILSQAEQYGIPVLLLPPELTFSAIVHTLIEQIELGAVETDSWIEVLRQKYLKAVMEDQAILFASPDQVYTLLAMVADDSLNMKHVEEGMMRISSYLSSQGAFLCKASVPEGSMVFCLVLPRGSSINNCIFELTILLTFMSEQRHVNFFIGVQKTPSPTMLDAAYTDALRCCETLLRVGARRGTCYAPNLPFFELFHAINRNSRQSVVGKQSVLHTLLDYDRAHGTSYVHTLRVYLAQGGAQSATASRLFIHRHTLTHRINKINQLCGWDLNDHYMRTYLSVMLMLHDYFAF
ncbi:PucR family transcriptional regulator ligand-binding domain-containing protein [Oscillospiraceae bacterium MB08-C2-2]|nr:PucR family transcriptional regulator ligand-binding domain-containing protein [Oscillospiraceae bacterium MB08-C2-2]